MNYVTIYNNNITTSSKEGNTTGSINIRLSDAKSRDESSNFTLVDAIRRMVRFTNAKGKNTCQVVKYTTIFNNWVNGFIVCEKSDSTRFKELGEGQRRQCEQRTKYRIQLLEGVLDIIVVSTSMSKSNLTEFNFKMIVESIRSIPTVQMETQQGDIAQDSDKANNTIVTRDAGQTEKIETGVEMPSLENVCSTEPVHRFESIANRWMALPSIEVKTTDAFNSVLRVYNLPSFLFTDSAAPNMMPFENFLFGKYEIVFKFVVNANKFHVGKVAASVKYDSYQMDVLRNDLPTMLSRPHVIMDLAVNNEAVLGVPFKYHRTYVRNASLKNSQFGSKVAQYGTIQVSVLSPLGAIAGAPTNMFIRPFYAIRKGVFTGMSYKVPLAQMEDVAYCARVLENSLKFIGKIPNMDKPYDDKRVSQVVLRPRLNFQSGKGASDCVPMRLDPLTQTTYLSDHHYPEDPTNILEIARIWGFAGKFEWKAASAEGSQLFSMPIEPSWRQRLTWEGAPTPLEYVSAMYQFWSGPLEVRLDFVSNAFHTGSIMMSAEFGRTSSTVEQSGSTYTKVFHLGDQKSVEFTIPYIYDTVWRRTAATPFLPLRTALAANPKSGQNAVIRANSSVFSVRVINALVPVQSVVQDIEVLVFIRAGEQFILHSPIMSNMLNAEQGYVLNNFPGEFTTQALNRTGRSSLNDSIREKGQIQVSHKWISGSVPKQTRAQILVDRDEEETTTTTTPQSTTVKAPPLIRQRVEHLDTDGAIPKVKPNPYKWVNSKGDSVTYRPDYQPPSEFEWLYLPPAYRNPDGVLIWEYEKPSVAYSYRNNKISGHGITSISPPPWGPSPQMDAGEKEALDNTQDFQQGCSRDIVQTVESHLNIKDLLRRPVCIMSNVSVAAMEDALTIGYFYIPCMPPSDMITYGDEMNRNFTPLLGRSMTTHLLDMFRFWRGSQRYSIIVHRSTGAPVYACYMPHSGATCVGRVSYNKTEILNANAPPSAVGLATEILIPSVNPTIAIEAPYETEVNWTLMMCENWERNFSWRDKGDYNCGHIVVWSKDAFTMDVFWSAGDDFAVSNFYGPPVCRAMFSKFMYTDNFPEPQMEDFQATESRSFVSRLFHSKFGFPVACGAASQVPVIGTSLVTAMAGYKANETIESANRVLAQVEEVTAGAGMVISRVDSIMEILQSKLGSIFDVTSSIYNAAVNGLFDILLMLRNWDPYSISISVLRFIANLMETPITVLSSFVNTLVSLFRVDPVPQDESSIEQISETFWTEQKIKDFWKVAVGIIGTILGVVIPVGSWSPSSLIKTVLSIPGDYRNVLLANGLMRFAENTFTVFKDAVVWVASYINPESKAIVALRGSKAEIDEFVKESQILTNECNKGSFVDPSFRLRYWVNVMKAYEIQRMLVGLPNSSVSTVLHRLCTDVIKQGKENMADLRCSPIKYEPYVVCIVGSAGIGKSMLVQDLAKQMLHAIGITKYSGDPLYYRISGSKHWNGYTDQPVVVYDDWMNITDPQIVAQVLNELYQLKSCATFVPEQAAIEDKKIKATPRLVILLCNEAFPDSTLTNMVSCRNAVYRRRDILVRAQVTTDYLNKDLRSLTLEESQEIKHLEFIRYRNPLDKESLEPRAVNYAQFAKYMVESFKVYDVQELNNVKRRTDNLLTFFSNTTLNIRDPFSVFYQAIELAAYDNQELQSQRLEDQIQMIVDGLDEMEERRFMPIPPNPSDPWAQFDLTTVAQTLLGVSVALPTTVLVFRKLADMFRKMMGALPTYTCNICLENTQISYVCAESWRTLRTSTMEGLHRMCESCYRRMPRPYRCGVCRNSEVPLRVMPVEYYNSISLIVRAYRMSNKVDNFVSSLIRQFKDNYGPEIWIGLTGAIGIIHSAIVRYRIHSGTATIPIIFWNVVAAAETGFSCYLISKTCSSELSISHSNVPVDVTAGRKLPLFVAFDDNSRDYIRRAINFNSGNAPFDQHVFRTLMEEGEELKRNFLGDDYEWYIQRFTQSYCTEEVTQLNNDIDEFNKDLIAYKHSGTLDRHSTDLRRRSSRILRKRNTLMRYALEPQMEEEHVVRINNPFPITHFSRYDLSEDLPYEFDRAGIPVVESRDATVCPHKAFTDHIANIRYENGIYAVTCRQGFVSMEVYACALDPGCPFHDMEDFCKRFFQHNKALWFSWIVNLNIDQRAEQIKNKLPRYAWPSWVVVEPVEINMPILESSNWWESTSLTPVLKKLLTALAIGASAIVVLKSVTGLFKMLSPVAQIIPSGDAVIRHFKPKAERIARSRISAQSEMQSAIIDKVNANFFSIIVEIDGTADKFLNGIGIKQRLGLIPKHYFEYMKTKAKCEGCKFYLARPYDLKQKVEISFCESDFTWSDTADICVFQLPQSSNMFKDITRYMASDEDMQRKMANTGVIVKPAVRVSGVTSVIPIDIKGYERRKFILDKNNGYVSEHCLAYNFSQAGACGSVVLKDHSQRPIVAMHIAGVGDINSGTGYGVVLTQEMFAEFQCEVSGEALQYEEPLFLDDVELTKVYLPEESVVTYEGILPKKLVPYAPHKSKIKPSLIQNDLPWKSIKEPAILTSSDPRYQFPISPLVAGAAKHGYLTKNMPSNEIEKVAKIRSYQLQHIKPGVIPAKRLSIEEAIVGFEGIPFYDPLHLDTSAGWPLCTNAKTLKQDYCKVERNLEGRVTHVEVDDVVREQVEKDTENRKKGIVPFTIFVDTLKDEKRKKEKLMTLGGTRVFCASPFAFSICMRQIFLHFAAAYMANRWSLKHAVGINLQGRECTELVSRLLSKGNKIVTIDYSNFGPGFNACIARAAAGNIKKWILSNISDVTSVEVDCLIEENLNSIHALNHLVYRQMGGSPSGSPITVIINSEVNILYVMMAWNALVNVENKWQEFEDNVCLFVYGDDLIMSVNDKYIDRFNGKTITDYFATYNIAATDASKSDEIKAWTGIEEASFLKCFMKPHPTRRGEWIAQLDINSVLDTPMWIKEELDFKAATRVNAEAGVRAAYSHGKEYFDKYQEDINRALSEKGIEPILLDWDEIDANFYDI